MKSNTSRPSSDTIHSLREFLRTPGGAETLVFVIAILSYICTAAFGFVFDDRTTLSGLASANPWQTLLQAFIPHNHHTGGEWIVAYYYRPVLTAVQVFCYQCFKLWAPGWHIFGALLNAIASVLVYKLGLVLWRQRNYGIVAALLFAAHPVHLQTVVWVSGFSDLLAGLMLLASVLCFLCWVEGRSRLWHLPALLFGVMALMSKETAVALPFLLLLSAFAAYTHRTRLRVIVASLPYFLLTLIYLLVRFSSIHNLPGNSYGHLTSAPIAYSYPLAAWFYLRQLLASLPISPVYPMQPVSALGSVNFWLPLLLLLLAVAALVAWTLLTRKRWTVIACAGWIVLPILPVFYAMSSFVGGQMVNERYLYASSVGFCLLAAALICHLASLWHFSWGRIHCQFIAGAAIALLLAVSTVVQQQNWASDVLLFNHALRVAPNDETSMLDLSTVYYEHAADATDAATMERYYNAGDSVIQRMLILNPDSINGNYNYGISLFRRHRFAEAATILSRSVRSGPDDTDACYYLAMSDIKTGEYDKAEALARWAIARHPKAPNLHAVLGAVLLKEGNKQAAIPLFEAELAIQPGNEMATLGLTQARQ